MMEKTADRIRAAHVAIRKMTDQELSEKYRLELEFAEKATQGHPVWWESVWLAECCRAEVFRRGLRDEL